MLRQNAPRTLRPRILREAANLITGARRPAPEENR
jgi:hypothetical protein